MKNKRHNDLFQRPIPIFNGSVVIYSHYCPVKILDLEINRVDHHPLGR